MTKMQLPGPTPGIVQEVAIDVDVSDVGEAHVTFTAGDAKRHEIIGPPGVLHDLAMGILNGLDPRHHRIPRRAPRRELRPALPE